jgi:hypothetical protein
MEIKDEEEFAGISGLKKSLHLFEITYAEFMTGDEENPETFAHKIHSANEYLVKKYIENFCSKTWPEYKFKWKDDKYESNEIDEKSVYATFSEILSGKVNVDAVLYPKND